MKQVITITALIGSLIIILSTFHIGNAIAYFLLAGVVPGTDIVISPSEMFVLIAGVAGFSIARLTISPLRRLTTNH